MSLLLDMTTKFFKLLIIGSRTMLVFMCESSVYFSAPSLLACASPHLACSGDGTVLTAMQILQ